MTEPAVLQLVLALLGVLVILAVILIVVMLRMPALVQRLRPAQPEKPRRVLDDPGKGSGKSRTPDNVAEVTALREQARAEDEPGRRQRREPGDGERDDDRGRGGARLVLDPGRLAVVSSQERGERQVGHDPDPAGPDGPVHAGDDRLGHRDDQPLQLDDPPRIVDGSHVEHAKPAPDLLLRAAEELGVAPPRAWYVGDATWDMLAARAAAMPAIGVTTGAADAEVLRGAGAQLVVATLDELHDLMLANGVLSVT